MDANVYLFKSEVEEKAYNKESKLTRCAIRL